MGLAGHQADRIGHGGRWGLEGHQADHTGHGGKRGPMATRTTDQVMEVGGTLKATRQTTQVMEAGEALRPPAPSLLPRSGPCSTRHAVARRR